MQQIRSHLTYANVMSSIAVFMVLGGATAVAATKIGANELKANSIKTGKIVKEAVTAGKIKNAAVTEAKLADGSVTTAKIANLAVTGEKVNEATLGPVPSASSANTANTASTANIGLSPVAYARVSADGTLIAAQSRGLSQANVSLESEAAYCFKNLPFEFKTAMAVVDFGDPVSGAEENGEQVSVAVGNPYDDCESAQLEVAGEDDTGFTPVGFYVWFYN